MRLIIDIDDDAAAGLHRPDQHALVAILTEVAEQIEQALDYAPDLDTAKILDVNRLTIGRWTYRAAPTVPAGSVSVAVQADSTEQVHGPYKSAESAARMGLLYARKAVQRGAARDRVTYQLVDPVTQAPGSRKFTIEDRWLSGLRERQRSTCRHCGENIIRLDATWVSGEPGRIGRLGCPARDNQDHETIRSRA